MRLSTKTRYGVRALFDMAYHGAGGPTQAKDIARRQDIPLRYLEQIFQDLKKAGIVDSKRGPRGGYQLKSDPREVKLGDIVRALQGPIEEIFAPDELIGAGAGTTNAGPTASRRAMAPGARLVTASLWRELAAQVTSWFDAVSLADMVKRGAELGVPRGDVQRPMYFI